MSLQDSVIMPNSSNYKLKAFVTGLLLAFILFLPFIILGKGVFIFLGDFNSQQIPFYQHVHRIIRDGDFLWSWSTDLGSNTLSSYSFYLIGSPFFLVTLPFPNFMVPYLMGPLLILKFACAAFTACVYLDRYVKNKNYAVLGAILYAFSGFSVYNIFFNHFHEAIVIFPLVLAALDAFVLDKKRGLITLSFFAACFINFYFFVSMAVFCVIYFIVRVLLKSYNLSLKEFFILIFEAVLGVTLSAVLLLPTILTLMNNYRVSEHLYGWDMLLYQGNAQRYPLIFGSLFFPPDLCSQNNFAPEASAHWASVALWLPLVGPITTIAWIDSKRKNWLKTLVVVLFVMTFVPILNSTFQLFNQAFYTRWFFCLTLMLCLVTVSALEDTQVDLDKAVKKSLLITLIIALPVALLPLYSYETKEFKQLGLSEYPDEFCITATAALICLLLFRLITKRYSKNKAKLPRALTVSTVLVSLAYASILLALGTAKDWRYRDVVSKNCINSSDKISLPYEDTTFDRIESYPIDNISMCLDRPTLNTFHSVVPNSIFSFYYDIFGLERGVESRPEFDLYAIRALTSTRWILASSAYEYDSTSNNERFDYRDGEIKAIKMPDYRHYQKQNDFDIWENEHFIPMGFTYDYYMTLQQCKDIKKEDRHLALLKALVLDESAIRRNSDILRPANTHEFEYSKEQYSIDCQKRKELSCNSFSYNGHSFSAKIDLKQHRSDELVFFSVPYEDGWSAKVNGKDAIIEKAHVGFMAVRAPKGEESIIEFNYYPPGLNLGIYISSVSLFAFIFYYFLSKKSTKRKNA